MTSQELRNKFLSYFQSKGHLISSPSLLIPENDPSVLFTSAGMQQFKKYYLEPKDVPNNRITTVQPCVRTSDIEEVGDKTHLTLFEMLGNFSFDYPKANESYFKKDAIIFAWEFLTETLQISKDRISATYFTGDEKSNLPKDADSYNLIKEITNLPEDKITGTGKDETFWGPTGDEGPCGPTVEFYVDGVEIWNLVFNQFYFRNGKYTILSQMGIDTGMGLERLLVQVNNVSDVYKTDLFTPIILKLESLTGKKYDEFEKEFRIISDHLKASIFMIGQDILPSNKYQGYVVRRLIRRAIVQAHHLGNDKNFCSEVIGNIIEIYGDNYPFLSESKDKITAELDKEETKFRKTLNNALKKLNSLEKITASELFDLYQSYGLPVQISLDEAKTQNKEIEDDILSKFDQLLKKHQETSRTTTEGTFKGGLVGQNEVTIKYHTATHLLHAALRKVLGTHVQQKGSNINTERLRFDFTHPTAMTKDQVKEVENLVNEVISQNLEVKCEEMETEKAKDSGALGFFAHKYGDVVKVYSIGDFSKEICGGPHVANTKELGKFEITKEESSSSGVRRIKAILK